MSERPFKYGNHLSRLLTGAIGVREVGQWHDRLLEGLPAKAVEAVKEQAELTDTEVALLLGISEATLRRIRAADAQLDPATSDRLYRFSKVLAVAVDVMESEHNAMAWLRRPQPGLAGRIPLDLLLTQPGADEVETLLRRIDYGIYT